jgi:hypothetical protein
VVRQVHTGYLYDIPVSGCVRPATDVHYIRCRLKHSQGPLHSVLLFASYWLPTRCALIRHNPPIMSAT